MADWGLKLSREGKDISSSDPTDFVFDSKNDVANVFIVLQGAGTVTIASSSATQLIINHSLTYVPMAIIYAEYTPGSGEWMMTSPDNTNNYDTYIVSDTAYTYVDDTYIKAKFQNRIASQRIVKYYYFILGDTAN